MSAATITALAFSSVASVAVVEVLLSSMLGINAPAAKTSSRVVAFQVELAFDVAAGAEFDLTAPLVQRIILGWMRAGIVAGLWLAFPCGTYSIARHPALRSKDHLRGLPHWKADPKASQLIRLGNATLEAALKFCRAALQLGIVAVGPGIQMACSPLRAARSVSVLGIRGRLEPELAACIVSPGKKRVAVTYAVF